MQIDNICDGLWENSIDSIRHALDHFRELASQAYHESNKYFNLKWAIVSVHQAAENFFNILLIKIDPTNLKWSSKGELWFPSLRDLTKKLIRIPIVNSLSPGEVRLLQLIKNLPDIRDRLIHRNIPNELDPTVAIISVLGLLHVARKRIGNPIPSFDLDLPRIESEVFPIIPYKRVENYCQISEQLLANEFPDKVLGICENCGTRSIIFNQCEICFEEMDSIMCCECGNIDYIPSWKQYTNLSSIHHCSYCGKLIDRNGT